MAFKRVFTLRLHDEIFDELAYLASTGHRSMTNMIEFILLDYLQRHEQTNGALLKHIEPK